jgi:hypothetical protein
MEDEIIMEMIPDSKSGEPAGRGSGPPSSAMEYLWRMIRTDLIENPDTQFVSLGPKPVYGDETFHARMTGGVIITVRKES